MSQLAETSPSEQEVLQTGRPVFSLGRPTGHVGGGGFCVVPEASVDVLVRLVLCLFLMSAVLLTKPVGHQGASG